MDELSEMLFKLWMIDNKPHYYSIVGGIVLCFGLCLIATLVLIWFFDWWWKFGITVVVLFFVFRYINKIILTSYIEQWRKRKI